MFTFLGILAVGAFIVLASNYKLFKRVKGWYYRSTNRAADAFGTVVDDMKDNIKNAGAEANEFKTQIAELMAANSKLNKEHQKSVADAEKWSLIAREAAEAQNEQHVRSAVEKKQSAEKHGIMLATTVANNEKLIQKLRSQLDNRFDQIKIAQTDVVTQEARFTSLQMRERMLQASNSFGNSELDSLTKTKEELDAYEAKLDALDTLTTDDAIQLEKIYHVDTKVDEEVSKLMGVGK